MVFKICIVFTFFHGCTARFVSDLFENHIVGFPTRRLKCCFSQNNEICEFSGKERKRYSVEHSASFMELSLKFPMFLDK